MSVGQQISSHKKAHSKKDNHPMDKSTYIIPLHKMCR